VNDREAGNGRKGRKTRGKCVNNRGGRAGHGKEEEGEKEKERERERKREEGRERKGRDRESATRGKAHTRAREWIEEEEWRRA